MILVPAECQKVLADEGQGDPGAIGNGATPGGTAPASAAVATVPGGGMYKSNKVGFGIY